MHPKTSLYFFPKSLSFILLFLGMFLFEACQQANSENLASRFFVPVENIYKPTPKRHVPETLEEKAFAEYDRKDFPEAAKWFGMLEEKSPEVRFYEANALLASKQSAKAVQVLEPLLKEDHAYRQLSEWLLALAYLQQDRKRESQALLEVIINTPGHPNQQHAAALWDAMT